MGFSTSCNYSQNLNLVFGFESNTVIQDNVSKELAGNGIKIWKDATKIKGVTLEAEVKTYGKIVGWFLSLIKVSVLAKRINSKGQEQSFYVNKKDVCLKIIRAKQLIIFYQTGEVSTGEKTAISACKVNSLILKNVLATFKSLQTQNQKMDILQTTKKILNSLENY